MTLMRRDDVVSMLVRRHVPTGRGAFAIPPTKFGSLDTATLENCQTEKKFKRLTVPLPPCLPLTWSFSCPFQEHFSRIRTMGEDD